MILYALRIMPCNVCTASNTFVRKGNENYAVRIRTWSMYGMSVSEPRRVCCRSMELPKGGGTSEGDDDSSGNPDVQDALVSMLKFEVGKKKVEQYVEDSSEKLRQKAESAKEELDKLEELANARGNLAFDSAIADINKEADEFEEQLKRNREEIERREKEQLLWEDDVARQRSEGQFFKQLYERKTTGLDEDTVEEAHRRAYKVKETAKEEVRSPIRLYLFFALAFLLAADVGADVASGDPSLGPDVLYTGLAALSCWLALNEKRG